jgi:hypothetical protein
MRADREETESFCNALRVFTQVDSRWQKERGEYHDVWMEFWRCA